MKSKGQRNAQIGRRIGEGSVEHLSVDDGDVPGFADEGHGVWQLFAAAVGCDAGLDINPAKFVRAWHNPKAVAKSGGIELNLEVETVNARIPICRGPNA